MRGAQVQGDASKLCTDLLSHLARAQDCLPLGIFNPTDKAAHGRVFKPAQGDGLPVFVAGFHVVLLSELDRKAAAREFAGSVPLAAVDVVLLTA